MVIRKRTLSDVSRHPHLRRHAIERRVWLDRVGGAHKCPEEYTREGVSSSKQETLRMSPRDDHLLTKDG
jgi:hypothetical protein